MIKKSTIQLIRIHFSFFLMPVYWYALSQTTAINPAHAILVFIIFHLLVYPASNGYNSYMDRDTGSIGGIKDPMQPTKQLFYVSVLLDVTAVLLSFIISLYFAFGVVAYGGGNVRQLFQPRSGFFLSLVRAAHIIWIYLGARPPCAGGLAAFPVGHGAGI